MVPVGYVVAGSAVSTLLLVALCALLMIGAVLPLKRQVQDMARQESQTREAVDRLAHIVAAGDQRWFWTEEWQAGEHEAEEQIGAGGTVGVMSEGEFGEWLDRLDAEANSEQKIGQSR